MRNRRYQTEAMIEAGERRKREDEAPRLHNEVSHLAGLRLLLEEHHGEGVVLAARHTKHVVVQHAPALFHIPCTDPACRDGGHDLTGEVMRALRESRTEFQGEDVCSGQRGTGYCDRVLHYVAHATYAN